MRDPREVFGKKLGFMAGGGGYRGIWAHAAMKVFCRRGIYRPELGDYSAGVSVGAIIKAHFNMAHHSRELPQIVEYGDARWRHIDKTGPQVVFPNNWNSWHILGQRFYYKDNSSLVALLDEFNSERSLSSPSRFDVYAIDYEKKRRVCFSNREERFKSNPQEWKNAIAASASLIPFLNPTDVFGRPYYDGGHLDFGGAIEEGCDTVFILYPFYREYRKPISTSNSRVSKWIEKEFPILDEGITAYATALREGDLRELEMVELYNKYVAAVREDVGIIEKLKNVIPQSVRELLALETPERPLKPLNAIPFYGDCPSTLSTRDFKTGDIILADQMAQEQIEKFLDEALA